MLVKGGMFVCVVCGWNVCVGYVNVYVSMCWSVCMCSECLEMCVCVYVRIRYDVCVGWCMLCVCCVFLLSDMYEISVLLVVSIDEFQWKHLPAFY